ncbi:MAG TPA: HEAT repeat domain-containing protein [Thermotogota bacterium]|nr:HEAT repeat domain-containing protein [Thermotogota bacterium]HPJ87706.1 HEAT repeat domain-containing protein [Thermotogota bacterium]HPR94855.1 HEAT repeat domain-containing protein [Thermotogota bacterium]
MSFKIAKELVSNFEQKNVAKFSVQYDELLNSVSPSVRMQAISGMIKFELNSEKIAKLLEDPHPGVRKTAVKYFREMGVADDYEKMIPLLDDPEESVCIEAIQTIYWLTSDYELRPMLNNDSPKIRLAVLKTLEEEIENETLEPLLTDLNPGVQKLALSIKIKRTQDVELLKKTVSESSDFQLRKTALVKLIPIEPKYCLEKLEAFLTDRSAFSDRERQSFISIIKDLPLDIAEKIVNGIVEQRKDDVLIPKLIMPYVNLNIEAPSRVISSLEYFVEHENAEIRAQSLKGFAKLNETSTVPIIRSKISDPDERVRTASMNAMSKMLDYHIVEIIDDVCKDYSKNVRKAAVRAIGRLKIEDAYSFIIDTIKNYKEDDGVRKESMNIAARLKLGEAVPILKQIMQNPQEDFDMINISARSLLRISPEAVIELLS